MGSAEAPIFHLVTPIGLLKADISISHEKIQLNDGSCSTDVLVERSEVSRLRTEQEWSIGVGFGNLE